MQKTQRRRPLFHVVLVSIMAGIALVMQYFDFPLPPFPGFLKIDFSEVPALITAVVLGPAAGIMVEFLKNVLHFLIKGSDTGFPIGQLANFLAGTILILGTSFIYKRKPTKIGLLMGILTGSILMAIIMSVANFYFILPFYEKFMEYTMTPAQRLTMVISGIGPFNFVKGLILAVVMLPIYVSLKPRLKSLSNKGMFAS